jgi:hypothetical protein
VYRTRAKALDVPYSDVFVVDTKWVFEQGVAGLGPCNVKVFVEVVFVKSCWVKGM